MTFLISSPSTLFRAAGLACLALALVGCGAVRTVQFGYTKKLGNTAAIDNVVINDEGALKATDGVENVIIRPDANGVLQLTLYVDEDNKAPGMTKALGLGYVPTRN